MSRALATAICCVLSFVAGAALVTVQSRGDPGPRSDARGDSVAAAAPDVPSGVTRREPQFENDQLRAWKSIIMPNQPLNLHRHENGRALIALTDGQLQVVDGAGKVLNTYNWERGKAYYLGADPPGEMHADVNRTSRPIEVIVVELQKKPQP